MRSAVLATVALILLAGIALAVLPGEPAPEFDLRSLTDDGRTGAPACFAEAPATVLLVWDRGCPHCIEKVLSAQVLADSLVSLGAQVLGIALGPDDPEALTDLLWDRGILIPHLWDPDRRTAALYGLGFRHLGIFVVDRAGIVRSVFDDKVLDLCASVLPRVRELIERAAEPIPPATRFPDRADASGRGWPAIRFDARMRLLSSEGARHGDRGFLGEPLESGILFLHRLDLRWTWGLSDRLAFDPWLRLGNEPDPALTEGAEQLTSRFGTASLRYSAGRARMTLGAFPMALSPLSLQRWDREDAPPLGGVFGCGCGMGAPGLSQKSLEILAPDYTFEGIEGGLARRFASLHAWMAVPRWERAPAEGAGSGDPTEAQFRRILSGLSVDLGGRGAKAPPFDLAVPLGLRAAAFSISDDRRTLEARGPSLTEEQDERTIALLGAAGPWFGVGADGEWAHSRRTSHGVEKAGRGLRVGIRGAATSGSLEVQGRLHRIRTDAAFAPYYRALTYEPNREGWRAEGGVRWLIAPGAMAERIGFTAFVRRVHETDPLEAPAYGPIGWQILSLSFLWRPRRDLAAQLHWIDQERQTPGLTAADAGIHGGSLELRFDGIPALDPMLRIEAIRSNGTRQNHTTIWNIYGSVRIIG